VLQLILMNEERGRSNHLLLPVLLKVAKEKDMYILYNISCAHNFL